MKNLLNTTLCVFFAVMFLYSPSYAQNITDVSRDDGVVMYRDGSIGRMDFHSRPQDDFEFIYMRASDTTNLNNLILTEGGMMLVGVDDLCGGLVALPPTMPDVKLFVDGGFDVAKYGSSLWSVVSDERLKKDITPLQSSLDLLRQVEFYEYAYNGLATTPDDGKKYFGVMAQQVGEILPSTITPYQQKMYQTDTKPTNLLKFNPNDLFYTGLNAIKELAVRTDELEEAQEENEILEERVQALEDQMTALMEALQGDTSPVVPEQQNENTLSTQQSPHIGTAQLFQNAPNPLHHSTKIRYYLPENMVSASIAIQDLTGKTLQKLPLNGVGEGEVTFNAQQNGLISGTYLYTLEVNGQVISSKKMILTR